MAAAAVSRETIPGNLSPRPTPRRRRPRGSLRAADTDRVQQGPTVDAAAGNGDDGALPPPLPTLPFVAERPSQPLSLTRRRDGGIDRAARPGTVRSVSVRRHSAACTQ